MNIKIAALTVTALFLVVGAEAQDLKKSFSAGFGIEAGPTLGPTRVFYNGLIGFNAWVAVREGEGFVTAGTGIIPFLPNKDHSPYAEGDQIPVLVGYKYFLPQQHVFVKMETGASRFTRSYRYTDITPLTNWGFTLAPSAGIQLNTLELSVKYVIFPATGVLMNYAAVQLGFDF